MIAPIQPQKSQDIHPRNLQKLLHILAPCIIIRRPLRHQPNYQSPTTLAIVVENAPRCQQIHQWMSHMYAASSFTETFINE